jgi:threonine/homoserine/homoserine lactone efflux protein
VSSLPLAAVSVAWLASALAFAVATAGTPGPNNAMLTSSGSLWGFRRTVPHMLGVSIGFPIMLIAVAAGGGDLLIHHPAAVTVMRWLGASYLLYLAWKIGSARPDAAGSQPEHGGSEPERGGSEPEHRAPARSRPLSFAQAALFQWVNVKAWLITISALATLTPVAHHPSFGRAVVLAGIFLSVTLPITAFWTTVGVGVSRVARTPRALRRFNLSMAALLVASVVSVVAGVG